jgi:prevent-host-death family protein
MEKTITASEANRAFSRILREVVGGDSFVVTSHGRAVARIVPAVTPEREAARRRLLDHLRGLPAMHAGPFDRDEAYE